MPREHVGVVPLSEGARDSAAGAAYRIADIYVALAKQIVDKSELDEDTFELMRQLDDERTTFMKAIAPAITKASLQRLMDGLG